MKCNDCKIEFVEIDVIKYAKCVYCNRTFCNDCLVWKDSFVVCKKCSETQKCFCQIPNEKGFIRGNDNCNICEGTGYI